jgi:protocatechuate 3,4-dioxygenase alpha subunit
MRPASMPIPTIRARPRWKTGFAAGAGCSTDFDTGLFGFDTVKPGSRGRARAGGCRRRMSASGSWPAGINLGLHTRMYFADEACGERRPIRFWGLIEQAARRKTVIATRGAGIPPVYRFDIRLQGDAETVFFDI